MPRACDSERALSLPAIAAGGFSSCNRCSLKIGGELSLGAGVALALLGCLLSVAVPVGIAIVSFAPAARVDAPLAACVKGGGLVACPRADRAAVTIARGAR